MSVPETATHRYLRVVLRSLWRFQDLVRLERGSMARVVIVFDTMCIGVSCARGTCCLFENVSC